MQRPSQSLDQEWLENSRVALREGLQKFVAPLLYFFVISDYIYAKEKIWLLLGIRTILAVSVFGLVKYITSAKNKRQFLNRYLVVVAWFSFNIYLLAYLILDEINVYPAAMLVVVTGAFAFISMPRSYYYSICAICYTPFALVASYRFFNHIGADIMWTNVCNVICIIVIFSLANRNFNRFQRNEFDSRQALNNILKERDAEINQLVGEVSTLKLKQSDFAKKEDAFKMARQVAHDIRSPISALNLATRKLAGSSDEIAQLIEASSKRINDIADTMLKKSRVDLAAQDRLYIADLGGVLRAIVEEKRLVANDGSGGKTVQFKIETPNAVLRARVFEADFSRAVSNLLQNSLDAIESGPAREGEIEVKVEVLADAVLITLRDNGRGIPAEIIGNVGRYGFTYGKPEGSGLGLAYAYNVVQAAGGQIELESKPERFTLVTMTLPLLKAEA